MSSITIKYLREKLNDERRRDTKGLGLEISNQLI